jgi:hypothetical protein
VPKSNRRSWFGLLNSHGTVTVIEATVARSYRRRALISFYVTVGVVGLLAATVASDRMHPITGMVLGILIGIAAGAVVYALVVAWPVLRVLWHWLPEIGLGLGLVYGWQALVAATPLPATLAILAVLVGVPAAVGPIRRGVTAWVMCLVVRHRLRTYFARFIRTASDGLLPLILLARPTPAGERVWIWLRPGVSLHDLEGDGEVQRLAVACWANEVRVVRASRQHAPLIRVDVTRREPLADTIVSPLPDYVPDEFLTNAPTSPGLPPTGLDLPEVPEPIDVAELNAAPVTRKPRNTPRSSRPDPSGFDPADYA